MTRILGLILTFVWLWPAAAVAGDLTLRDVIELRRSGLGDDLLIAVIEADGGPLTLTFADIQDLKSDGFSERLIAALVRTGARPQGQLAEGATPVVHVRQEVTNIVVPAVVIADPQVVDAPRRDRHRSRPPQPPPAAWVTRREDGKNVTSSGERRRGVPAAAWVTHREPKVEPRSDGKPKP